MATPRSVAVRTVRSIVAGSPAWNPQATFALVTTSSRAASSPTAQWPSPSPRSEFRSKVAPRLAGRGRGDQMAPDGQLDPAAVDHERAHGGDAVLEDAAAGVLGDPGARGGGRARGAPPRGAEPNRPVPTRVRMPVPVSPAAANSDPSSSRSPRAQ